MVDDSILLRGKVGDWPIKALFLRNRLKEEKEIDEADAA